MTRTARPGYTVPKRKSVPTAPEGAETDTDIHTARERDIDKEEKL